VQKSRRKTKIEAKLEKRFLHNMLLNCGNNNNSMEQQQQVLHSPNSLQVKVQKQQQHQQHHLQQQQQQQLQLQLQIATTICIHGAKSSLTLNYEANEAEYEEKNAHRKK